MAQKRWFLALLLALMGVAGAMASGQKTERFVQDLYRKFAYRQATPSEIEYWSGIVENWTPERAEKRLKHWFFVHAAYKTTLGRTVDLFEVARTVDMLDSGELDFRAVQYSLFHSPEYQDAKRRGLAGTMMIPLSRDPS